MNFRCLSDDIEIRAVCKSNNNESELFKDLKLNEGEDEYDLDITVPIIEIQCDDSDERKNSHVNNLILGGNVNDVSDVNHDSTRFSIKPVPLENGDTQITSACNEINITNKNSGNTNLKEEEVAEIYKCDLCGAGFRIKHSITKHKRVVHGMHQFTCMFCKNSYPLKRNLLDHIASHKGPHGFKCEVCNKVRPNYISIQRHVKTHAQKNIPCIKCGALFKTKWELNSHEIQHSEDRTFICEKCGLTFINPTKLREHLSRHIRNRPFKCEICGKDFNAQGNLTNHRKLHYDEKPFKCQYCSLSFFSTSARKRHVLVHAREKRKPYQCQDCYKKYSSTTSLAVHRMKFHSGGRVYHCHYCKQKFKSKSAITEHVAEHAAERPHSCQHCLCRYKNKRELRRHQREKEHYDTEERDKQKPLPYTTTIGSYKDPIVEVDDEEIEDVEDDWEMPEPEVCLRVAESDEEDIESILPFDPTTSSV